MTEQAVLNPVGKGDFRKEGFFMSGSDAGWRNDVKMRHCSPIDGVTIMPTTLSHPLKVAEIRSRIELDLKEEATRVLASCGLNVSDAIRLFLRQVVAQNGLPFEIKAPNTLTRAAMEEARSGNLPRFGSVQELFDDLEKNSEE